MSNPSIDWSQLTEIRYGFYRHGLDKYSNCHTNLNEHLASEIPIPDSIFMEPASENQQRTLVTDISSRLRQEITLDVNSLLTDAPSSFTNDPTHIGNLFSESMIKCKDGDRLVSIRTAATFEKVARKAISEGKDYIEIQDNDN